MLIKKDLPHSCLVGIFLFGLVTTTTAQTDFSRFWVKFKTAVIKKDKQKVVSLTVFPISDSGETETPNYSKIQFTKKFNQIFVNTKECFIKPKFERHFNLVNIDCYGKIYTFTKTKKGWKFTGFASY